jgi:RNA polymerase sigma-70 factor (sigma-E family)
VTFEEFVDLRLPALSRFAVMLTGDTHTAQDLVQDTMIRAHQRWRRISAVDSPERYVRRMIATGFIDLRRGPWYRRIVLRESLPETVAVPDPSDRSAQRDEMWLLLARLPNRQRAAVVLRYYEDLTDSEIAEVLGCAVGTVRGYISRALATLRTQWTPTTSHTGGLR